MHVLEEVTSPIACSKQQDTTQKKTPLCEPLHIWDTMRRRKEECRNFNNRIRNLSQLVIISLGPTHFARAGKQKCTFRSSSMRHKTDYHEEHEG